mmetsp:Transcript_57368/g.184320  ORF Transcript_57368/g.184320 Transcript_57368/m.184320 type:complete len:258 (+) Transcript_57368:341-1114(+)
MRPWMQCRPGFRCAWSTWYQCFLVVFQLGSRPKGRKTPAPSKDVTSASVPQMDLKTWRSWGRLRRYQSSSDWPTPREWMMPSSLPAGQPQKGVLESCQVLTSSRRILPARSLASMKSHSKEYAFFRCSAEAIPAMTTKPCSVRCSFQPTTSLRAKRLLLMMRTFGGFLSESFAGSLKPSRSWISRESLLSRSSRLKRSAVSRRICVTPSCVPSKPNLATTLLCTVSAKSASILLLASAFNEFLGDLRYILCIANSSS